MRTLIAISPFLLAILGMALTAAGGDARADICKWVDEDGVTHYAAECPEGVDSRQVELEPPPPSRQDGKQAANPEAARQDKPDPAEHGARPASYRSLPREQLGPLPDNAESTYLITTYTGLDFELEKLSAKFTLTLKAREQLPEGALLEAQFPDPANPAHKQAVSKTLKRARSEIILNSPPFGGLKCWNYEVEVYVYRDDSRAEPLDIHRQTIQSVMDFDLVPKKDGSHQLLEALVEGVGKCPSEHAQDLPRMSVKQLETLCEQERQKLLAPERAALISRCIASGEHDADWCKRYHADHGDAVRIDPVRVIPALYMNLPECIAAQKAREREKEDGAN